MAVRALGCGVLLSVGPWLGGDGFVVFSLWGRWGWVWDVGRVLESWVG